FGEFIEVVPAQQQLGPVWYRGTADAVHQNIELIVSHRPKHVLVLAGDHIYKMDYGPMIAYHVEKGADITVVVVEVPARESRNFGVLTATEWNRVSKFAEKPEAPDTLPTRPATILASMGIYVFNTQLLETLLAAAAREVHSRRGRSPRHGRQLHGVGRLHPLGGGAARVAAVLGRAHLGALEHPSLRDPAARGDRPRLRHLPRHHRRGVRSARRHA